MFGDTAGCASAFLDGAFVCSELEHSQDRRKLFPVAPSCLKRSSTESACVLIVVSEQTFLSPATLAVYVCLFADVVTPLSFIFFLLPIPSMRTSASVKLTAGHAPATRRRAVWARFNMVFSSLVCFFYSDPRHRGGFFPC